MNMLTSVQTNAIGCHFTECDLRFCLQLERLFPAINGDLFRLNCESLSFLFLDVVIHSWTFLQ